MSENRISMVVSSEQQAAALAAIAQVWAALPGLASAGPGGLRDLYHFRNKNDVFGRGVLRALEANPQIVPPSLDVAGARADLHALDALRPVLEERP